MVPSPLLLFSSLDRKMPYTNMQPCTILCMATTHNHVQTSFSSLAPQCASESQALTNLQTIRDISCLIRPRQRQRSVRRVCESSRRIHQHPLMLLLIPSVSLLLHSLSATKPLDPLRVAAQCVSYKPPTTACAATTVVKWLHPTAVVHAQRTPLEHAGNHKISASEPSRQCVSIVGAWSRSRRPINSTPPGPALWIVISSISL
jgi:hypothetical protein